VLDKFDNFQVMPNIAQRRGQGILHAKFAASFVLPTPS
jgi:hypothetical protein